MSLKHIIVLILLMTAYPVNAQSDLKPIKWVVRPSFGKTLSITKLSGGYITDNLVEFGSNTYYWQFISSTYFFKKWGIEFSFSGNHSSKLNSNYDIFISQVENKYSENYFVTAASGAAYSDFNIVSGTIEKGSIGPVYKIEKDRFVLIGRAMIGTTSFDTNWGSADLKGKGTNELINIHWSNDRVLEDCFSLNPSFTFGYRLFDRIVLDFDVSYWIYKIDIDYTETIENLNTSEIQSQSYTYSDWINELSFGIGLMIVLK